MTALSPILIVTLVFWTRFPSNASYFTLIYDLTVLQSPSTPQNNGERGMNETFQVYDLQDGVLYVGKQGPLIWILLTSAYERMWKRSTELLALIWPKERKSNSAIRSVNVNLLQDVWKNNDFRLRTALRGKWGSFWTPLSPIINFK